MVVDYEGHRLEFDEGDGGPGTQWYTCLGCGEGSDLPKDLPVPCPAPFLVGGSTGSNLNRKQQSDG